MHTFALGINVLWYRAKLCSSSIERQRKAVPAEPEDIWIDARLKESRICPRIIIRPLAITFSLIPWGWGLADDSLNVNLEERVSCLTSYLQQEIQGVCLPASPTHFISIPFVRLSYIWCKYSNNACSFFCFVFGSKHCQVVPGFSFCIHFTAFIKLPQ